MSKNFKVEIITPDNAPIVLEAESLRTGTNEGVVEIRANHTPMILSTNPSTTIINSNGEKNKFFTSNGVLYIKDNELKFCCDAAEKYSDIDISRAKASKERAEKRLKENKDIDIERAKLALARANARLSVSNNN